MIFVILLHCYDSPLSSTIVQSTKHDTDMGHGDANTSFFKYWKTCWILFFFGLYYIYPMNLFITSIQSGFFFHLILTFRKFNQQAPSTHELSIQQFQHWPMFQKLHYDLLMCT